MSVIGRLRNSGHGVDRRGGVKPANFVEPVFFMPRNDTHESVGKSFLTVRSVTQQHFVCFKEEKPNGSKRNDPHPAEGL